MAASVPVAEVRAIRACNHRYRVWCEARLIHLTIRRTSQRRYAKLCTSNRPVWHHCAEEQVHTRRSCWGSRRIGSKNGGVSPRSGSTYQPAQTGCTRDDAARAAAIVRLPESCSVKLPKCPFGTCYTGRVLQSEPSGFIGAYFQHNVDLSFLRDLGGAYQLSRPTFDLLRCASQSARTSLHAPQLRLERQGRSAK